MSTELLVRRHDKTPKTPFTTLLREVAGTLESSASIEPDSEDGFAFDELGIAVSVTLDENSNLTAARVQVSDNARIGHVSEVFKTFITLGWAL